MYIGYLPLPTTFVTVSIEVQIHEHIFIQIDWIQNCCHRLHLTQSTILHAKMLKWNK